MYLTPELNALPAETKEAIKIGYGIAQTHAKLGIDWRESKPAVCPRCQRENKSTDASCKRCGESIVGF